MRSTVDINFLLFLYLHRCITLATRTIINFAFIYKASTFTSILGVLNLINCSFGSIILKVLVIYLVHVISTVWYRVYILTLIASAVVAIWTTASLLLELIIYPLEIINLFLKLLRCLLGISASFFSFSSAHYPLKLFILTLQVSYFTIIFHALWCDISWCKTWNCFFIHFFHVC